MTEDHIILYDLASNKPDFAWNPNCWKVRRTREKTFGRKLEEFTPAGSDRKEAWERIRKGFDTIDGLIQKNGGPFAKDDQVSFVDFAFGGYLIWFKLIWGEESELWKDLVTWHDGRWGKYLERLEECAFRTT